MPIVKYFDLYLNEGVSVAPVIHANQYDETEQWIFTLYEESGTKYTPSTGAIVGIKSDRKGILNTATVNSNGQVVVNETKQITAAAGTGIFELLIDNSNHGTANFKVDVEPRPGDKADMSDSDYSLLQNAVHSAEEILDIIGDTDLEEVVAEDINAWMDAHPEATTTVQDGAITIPKLNDTVKYGTFEHMTVGTAQAVLSDDGITDKVPYKYRFTGGGKEVGNRAINTIVGGTIAWNQMAKYKATTSTSNGVTFAVDADGTVTADGNATGDNAFLNSLTATGKAGHVIYLAGCPSGGSDSTYYVRDGYITTNYEYGNGVLYKKGSNTNFVAQITVKNGITVTNLKFRPIAFDLTAMFGSTVADAIYAMEQSSAGSGVAYFRSLFPNSYYAYNSGELVSVEGLSAHETVGFNQWDEQWEVGAYDISTGEKQTKSTQIRSKNFIPCLPGTQYYISVPYSSTTSGFVFTCLYDADKQYISYFSHRSNGSSFTTPSNAHFMTFFVASAYGTVYKNDICINISSLENGTYKPYQKHSYPLDSSLTLRGVPKWNNGLYFDGDIYRHDGSVSRRYGVVDLGEQTWSRASEGRFYFPLASALKPSSTSVVANILCSKYISVSQAATWADGMVCLTTGGQLYVIDSAYDTAANFKTAMSGIYLVYELATPTTETADPYQQYQICDGKGTEEYVSETVTPVGHSTFYPVDIVAKVNKLPSDFSTLIAPTEKTFRATRNYTAKQFLIVDNQLYRVTANIANGGAITPNTNVVAVTIADILTSLI